MKTTILRLVLAVGIILTGLLESSAQVRVRGYTRKDGTYVAPHYRSSPNSTKADNWSTKGNVNPYTGQPGTRNPYPQMRYPSASASSQPYLVQPPPQAVTRQRVPRTPPSTAHRSALTQSPQKGTNQPSGPRIMMRYTGGDPLLEYQLSHAEKGVPESQYAMARRYLGGIGVEKNEEKGLEFMRKAAKQGHLEARVYLHERSVAARVKEKVRLGMIPAPEVAAAHQLGLLSKGLLKRGKTSSTF